MRRRFKRHLTLNDRHVPSALIVRGADTNRHGLAPQAAGLLTISVGLSRMYRDDLEQLGAGMLIYDAFYRWARDAVDEDTTGQLPPGNPEI